MLLYTATTGSILDAAQSRTKFIVCWVAGTVRMVTAFTLVDMVNSMPGVSLNVESCNALWVMNSKFLSSAGRLEFVRTAEAYWEVGTSAWSNIARGNEFVKLWVRCDHLAALICHLANEWARHVEGEVCTK